MDRKLEISLYYNRFMSQYMDLENRKNYCVSKYVNCRARINASTTVLLQNYGKLPKTRKLQRNFSGQAFLTTGSINRKIWKLERCSKFWEIEVPKYTETQFKIDFRTTRKSFEKLCGKLSILERQDSNWRKAIPLDKRVAIALYSLGSSSEHRTIATLFGVGRTTVGEIIIDFCQTVCDKMQSEYLGSYPPTPEKVVEITTGFESLGFPQCFGAIDGCHIEINPHKDEAVDYHNYKGWNSVILFASADYRYRFTYINIGSPGRNNDSYIFENSSLKKVHENDIIFSNNYKMFNNIKVPVLLIGDSAFRLSKYVMKPFPYTANQSEAEKQFNYRLSKCRRVIENAFGHLKARFRKIGRGLEVRPYNVGIIVRACCILHNFLNEESDSVYDSWIADEIERQNLQPQPQHITTAGENDADGKAIRRALTSFFSCNRPAEQDDYHEEARLIEENL